MLSLSKIEKIKKDILGKDYSLSVAYVSENKSRELNKKYRKKDRPTNVLSFSLRENFGELVICKAVVKNEVAEMKASIKKGKKNNKENNLGKNFDEWLGFLVIHGMLHLKGYVHGGTMERLERKYDQKYFSGHRRGLHNDASRGGRIHQGRKKS